MSENPVPDVRLEMRCLAPRDAVWQGMVGARGLCARGDLRGKRAGESFAIETGAGDYFSGTVVAMEPESLLRLRIDNMYGSLLELNLMEQTDGPEPSAGATGPTELRLSLTAVGLHHDEVHSFTLRWRQQLGDLFPGTLAPGGDWLF